MPADSSGFARADATRPLRTGATVSHAGAAGRAVPPAEPGSRRSERMEQRERLYSVVRESMVRSGVLSSGYKFKVLSLDARGGQFMVMMDLARDLAREPGRLSEVEGLIAQVAKQRFDIVVTAVYWRLNEHVVVNASQARPATAAARVPGAPSAAPMSPTAPAAAPATAAAPSASPLPGPTPQTVPVSTPVAASTPARSGARYEPLQDEEVAAFKAALAGAVGAARAETAARLEAKAEAQLRQARDARLKLKTDAPRKLLAWPKRPAQLTGYEDTEAFAPSELPPAEPQVLSETQYGELH